MSCPEPVIYLVDDEPAVLKAVSRLIRSAGYTINTFNAAEEFLCQRSEGAHGCIILDVSMPGLNGLELQQALFAKGMLLPIIFLTGRGDVPTSVRAMKQGAADFLTKPVNAEQLLSAVAAAVVRDRLAWQLRDEEAEIERRLATLTAREREVFKHVISGRLNKQTAVDLGTVEKTVKVHRARVMEKMRVKSLAELVRLAERAGIAPAVSDER
jgi:FixJ family two-component response regulator